MNRAIERKLSVLIVAESCNPRWTSVPLVAYSLVKALSARHDLEVTLISQVRNREALESDPIASQVRLHFIDNEFVGRPFFLVGERLRGGSQLSWTTAQAFSWPAYIVFEKMIFRQFRAELRAGSFDLIHRLSPLSPTMGSPLATLTDVPMLIGPLNGGLPWPRAYPDLWKHEREWLTPLRKLYRWLPYHRSMYRHLCGVIAGSRHTASEIPACYGGRRFYVPENGVDTDRIPISTAWNAPEPGKKFRFITIGRLVPYKGTALILEALARSPQLRRDAELIVIGEGPERSELERRTSELGLTSTVKFTGSIEHTRLRDELARAQAFVFPSLREFGGGVVLEAMASGLPPIVVDYGGPGELVTDDCGIRLPMAPREELVPQLAVAMEALVSDPDRCRRMSHACTDRVRREFTWPVKAEQIVAIYHDLLGLPQFHVAETQPTGARQAF
jgi:glycosyltransferase involved in cell wall biosynthesis